MITKVGKTVVYNNGAYFEGESDDAWEEDGKVLDFHTTRRNLDELLHVAAVFGKLEVVDEDYSEPA